VLPGLLESHSRAEPDGCSARVERVPGTGARLFISRVMGTQLCSVLFGKQSCVLQTRAPKFFHRRFVVHVRQGVQKEEDPRPKAEVVVGSLLRNAVGNP
jgi:hypothetical protein